MERQSTIAEQGAPTQMFSDPLAAGGVEDPNRPGTNYAVKPSMLQRAVLVLRVLLIAAIVCSCLYAMGRSLHWPLLVDSPIMHYVNFLMQHGMRPYQEITDNNLPGAYLTEGWAMRVFGGGDLGWRMYDFFLLGLIAAAGTAIGWHRDKLTGIYAGGLFALMHLSEGPWFAGEREEVMTALLLLSSALLFVSVRQRRPWIAALFGFAAALAASIKPTIAPFAIGALLLLIVALHRAKVRWSGYVLWALAGMGAVVAINALFFMRYAAFRPFLFVFRTVTPAYVGLNRPGWRFMVLHLVPSDFALLALITVAVVALSRRWDWERGVLLLGALLGAASYFLQGKGFFHHRYMVVAFLLTLAGMELLRASKDRGVVRLLGCAGLLIPLLYTVPHELKRFRSLPPTGGLLRSMESDLRGIGVDRLQGNVQCFDLVFGCLNSLYHLGVVENTGFTGDLLLFSKNTSAATAFYRTKFRESQERAPAGVYVITNEVFGEPNSFGKIDRWPEFADYLARNYTLTTQRLFPMEDVWGAKPVADADARAYRIYVRKDGATPEWTSEPKQP